MLLYFLKVKIFDESFSLKKMVYFIHRRPVYLALMTTHQINFKKLDLHPEWNEIRIQTHDLNSSIVLILCLIFVKANFVRRLTCLVE